MNNGAEGKNTQDMYR